MTSLQPVPRLTRRRSSSSPSLSRDGTLSRSSSTRLHSRAPGVTSQTGVSGASPGSVASRPMSSSSHATSSTSKSPYTSAPLNALDALAAHTSSSREADALPSSGTRGFTSLVLPRAAISPATSGSNSGIGWRPWKTGRRVTAAESLGAGLGFGDEIDLTRAGLAQTAMASVEIVRGIASGDVERKESKSRGPLFGFGWFSKGNIKQGKGPVPAESPLGFTVYRKPPVYVSGSSVLVQVWAVGLDDVDARLVGVHPPPSPGTPDRAEEKNDGKRPVSLGYIPGRSFVGRILEVGWDIDEHAVKKGEWVIGLNSVQRCGALAEFIVADRHRIHCVPHPYMPDQPSLVPASSSEAAEDSEGGQRNSLVFPSGDESKGLTVDELALLPLSGVSAYRAVRTLTHITRALVKSDVTARRRRSQVTSDTDEDDAVIVRSIKRGSAEKRHDTTRPRILILRGHDGPGALALQMLVRAGWSVWVHVPVPFDLPGLPHEFEDIQDEENKRTLEQRRIILERIEKRLREWGADEVLFVPIESSSISASTPRDDPSSSSPSLHHPQSSSSSSTHSQNISPSPFSRSSTSSTLSSPYLPSSTHGHFSSTSQHLHCALPAPYSYTGLPLTPYQTEKTSATALFTYLARTRVRFDAIIDTIGGREIWEAGQALLSLPVHDTARANIEGQFITLVGDTPDRVVSTASDHFRAGVRALRLGNSKGTLKVHDNAEFSQASVRLSKGKKDRKMKPRRVNYAWVNIMSDVDWEGADVRDSLSAVLAMAVGEGVRPAVGLADFPDMSKKGKGKMKAVFNGGDGETPGKVVPFENTPQVFVPGGGLEYGGTVVSRIAR